MKSFKNWILQFEDDREPDGNPSELAVVAALIRADTCMPEDPFPIELSNHLVIHHPGADVTNDFVQFIITLEVVWQAEMRLEVNG